jgi:hypothetical protein
MTTQNSTATNITGPDLSNNQDPNRYFNNFFSIDFSTTSDIDSAVTAYFQEYTGNAQSGRNLAAAVIYTAKAAGQDVMQVLDQFRNLPAGQLNSYLVAFLNFNRVPTSSLGYRVAPATNSYVSRTIIL